MWSLLKSAEEDCRKLRDALEEAAAKNTGAASVQTLTKELAAEDRRHIEMCGDCREVVQELVATKDLFQGAASFAEDERGWFASRVMAAIASRERELAERVSAWVEFPRFASRLSWVAAIVLLASTTWFYRSVVLAPNSSSAGSQESIFEAPQQSAPDDILISRASDNP